MAVVNFKRKYEKLAFVAHVLQNTQNLVFHTYKYARNDNKQTLWKGMPISLGIWVYRFPRMFKRLSLVYFSYIFVGFAIILYNHTQSSVQLKV